MSTIFTWGKRLSETDRAAVYVDDTNIFVGQWGEMAIDLSFSPRDPTASELAYAATQAITDFQKENPGIEMKYAQVTKSSPYRLIFQYESHTNPVVMAAIGAALAFALTLIVTNIIKIALATTIIAVGYALYKRLKPPVYQCPIDGHIFESWETLKAHMEYFHPGAPIPDRPTLIPGIPDVGAVLLIGGIAIAVAIAAPPLIRELRRGK